MDEECYLEYPATPKILPIGQSNSALLLKNLQYTIIRDYSLLFKVEAAAGQIVPNLDDVFFFEDDKTVRQHVKVCCKDL